MEETPELIVKETAFLLQRNGENLASAMVYNELALDLQNDAGVWTGLGSALAKSAGLSNKRPFYEWAARVLLRGLEIGKDGPFASPCINWLDHIAAEIGKEGLDLITDAQFEELRTFLHQDAGTLPTAIGGLEQELIDRSITAMGELQKPAFTGVMLAAIQGHYGDLAVKAALERIHLFAAEPGVRDTLAKVALEVTASNHQPYLGQALERIDPEWAKQFGEI